MKASWSLCDHYRHELSSNNGNAIFDFSKNDCSELKQKMTDQGNADDTLNVEIMILLKVPSNVWRNL